MKETGISRLVGLLVLCCGTQLVAGDVEIIGDGFRFTEGPAVDAQGNLYFTDIPAERIHVYTTAGKMELFRENSGKANGLYFDRGGDLLVCEGGNNRLTSISPQGDVTVLADMHDGKPFNRPNDLWLDPKGGIVPARFPLDGNRRGRDDALCMSSVGGGCEP